MKAFLSVLTLSFLPKSHDFGLLLLRVLLGIGMMWLHGWNKAQVLFRLGTWSGSKSHAASLKEAAANVDVFHLGGHWSLGALVFAEVTCSALLIIGFGSRFAALVLSFAMGVAFFVKHQHLLTGTGNGELPALYLTGFLVILIAGPGKFSFDSGGPVGAKD